VDDGMVNYQEFLQSKRFKYQSTGKVIDKADINPILFDFQKDIVKWAVKKGRCAIFLDTGLGKTFVQLEWARLIGGKSLIVAPLSVARQTIREAVKIGITVNFVHDESAMLPGINITNYELIDNFTGDVDAIVLDESSILKSISGKIKRKLIETFRGVPYKLCCTATPAPNDYIEIGNHAWFLEVCSHQEMLAMFFINANKEHTVHCNGKLYIEKGSNKGGQEWRIKHHAEEKFFEWMSSWAMFMMVPSDLGYDDSGYILPPLNIKPMIKEVIGYHQEDVLFFDGLKGISDRAAVRADMVDVKLEMLKELIHEPSDQWIVWCGLDKEAAAVKKTLGECCREVKGADSIESKVKNIEEFQDGKYPVLLTKGKIGGYGLNLQNASNMIFFGLSDSWESFYQCIRREWRFGQKNPVNVYILLSSPELEIYENIKRKELQATRLRTKMIDRMKAYEKGEIMDCEVEKQDYTEDTVTGETWKAMRGDSCVRMKEVESESIDLTVYSPPFENLFIYSNSDRDLGNCRNAEEFFTHYHFIVSEILRCTKPGRLSCVHTSDIPAMASRDGFIGIKDFPGSVVRLHIELGWEFFGRCVVQKNPQAQAIRTKCKSLLFVQMKKDSSCSRPAIMDQILIFKKPGDNAVPIEPVKNGDLNNETWINWAHGIWTDISETNTLQYYCGRDPMDEKHVAPLQLETIERCVKLYSNPGETVLTPFLGIGSEAFVAIKLGRRAVGIELKESYFKIAVQNIKSISASRDDLFSFDTPPSPQQLEAEI
jgi:DNA modification methylase/superfamily II DNA or RNA helicase